MKDGRPAPVRPLEEIIRLDTDDKGEVKVERRPREVKGKGKGKGGRGRGNEEGKEGGSMSTRIMDGAGTAQVDGSKAKGIQTKRKELRMEPHRLGLGLKKFTRDGGLRSLKGISDMKLRGQLKSSRRKDEESLLRLVKSQMLLTEGTGYIEAEGEERTFKFCQADLEANTSIGVAKKRFSIDLPYAPYVCDYTANGRHLLVGGHKGHFALMECKNLKLDTELHVKESVRAVKTLHNHLMFAVAQKKYVYIYDNSGLELHCLKDQKHATHLEFLPYHFLLVSGGETGELHYRDISTGQPVSTIRTRKGPCRAMRQNPSNGVIHMGNSNGIVSLWTPTVKEPVAKIFGHHGHVTDVAVDNNYMISAGADGYWKVWDLRKYVELGSFKCKGHAPSTVALSMTGLVAVAYGSHLQVWKDVLKADMPRTPYITEEYPSHQISSVRFQPYEDVLCVGHAGGFGTLIVPGAGFANYDSYEANPYQTKEQRREKEVRDLLDKLQPDSIMLDQSQIGNVNKVVATKFREEEAAKRIAEEDAKKAKKKKKKMRGKDKVGKRLKRKHMKEGAEHRQKAQGRIAGEESEESDSGDSDDEQSANDVGGAGNTSAGDQAIPRSTLGRFYGKRQRKT